MNALRAPPIKPPIGSASARPQAEANWRKVTARSFPSNASLFARYALIFVISSALDQYDHRTFTSLHKNLARVSTDVIQPPDQERLTAALNRCDRTHGRLMTIGITASASLPRWLQDWPFRNGCSGRGLMRGVSTPGVGGQSDGRPCRLGAQAHGGPNAGTSRPRPCAAERVMCRAWYPVGKPSR